MFMAEPIGVLIFSALIALGAAMVLKLSSSSTLQSLRLMRSELATILIAAGILAAIFLIALPGVR
jgi:hypothetical protein